jgi:hypothetical protein
MAGRPYPADPARMIPSPIPVNALVTTVLRIEARDARLFSLDAPTKQQILATTVTFGQPISDQELDRRLARLTEAEKMQFVRRLNKMDGRG